MLHLPRQLVCRASDNGGLGGWGSDGPSTFPLAKALFAYAEIIVLIAWDLIRYYFHEVEIFALVVKNFVPSTFQVLSDALVCQPCSLKFLKKLLLNCISTGNVIQ